ncbi:prepilin-type N-terminal cleavage/methylation domain-containing protein [Aliivibrio sifiae]|uniref:MSHA biogenesis protein MshC n=1 Tax=Aliivibrio sifiae TaxID=566293 RepID=A0A2S7XAG8_9GAMM|nr:prepilin-type N-terminal cleavage/methylation domain-containing protein [Aliivibrio sifiae]PQJ88267.1 MSHA biogenesis protein MshC [Aliivibrio sifiae]
MMIFPLVVSLQKQPIKTKGFTLVELVVVIVILAIIAIYTSSKYMGASRFSSTAAQEQVVSILRQVQIAAMQTNAPDNSDSCRSILMTTSKFGVSQSCQSQGMSSAALSDYSKDTDQQQLELIKLSYAFNSISGAVSELSFDLLGRPITKVTSSVSSSLCTASDCRITITTPSSNESRSVCINSEGFIYRSTQGGGCQI